MADVEGALVEDTEVDEIEEGEDQEGEQESGDQDDGELEISFDGEAAPASGERETGLVKHLREQLREKERRLAEAEKHRPSQIELGPKPTIANCEFDEERYETELDAWKARQAKIQEQETAQEQEARTAREDWERDQQSFRTKAAQLNVANFEEAETLVLGSLTPGQHVALVKGANNPALVTLALSKRPDKLAELSAIKDPFKAAAFVARLEGGLKVMPKRQATAPEEINAGSASMAKGSDKRLEELEKEADRTGDRTKVIAYKRSLRSPS